MSDHTHEEGGNQADIPARPDDPAADRWREFFAGVGGTGDAGSGAAGPWTPAPRTPEEPPAGRPTPRGRIVLAAFVALFVALATFAGLSELLRGNAPSSGIRESVQIGASDASARVLRSVGPAIVDINTYTQPFGSDQLVPLGAGTGMILTSSGEVLTNNHVIDGAWSIRVTIAGRPGTATATVVGVDPTDDVALLQLANVSGLPTVSLGDSSTLQVGDHVVAIGNAFGRGGTPTATSGTIAALDRSIVASDPTGSSEHLSGVIQTDAVISPGDSGGALVDAKGNVVGMITAGSSSRQQEQGSTTVGFAIPAEDALGVVDLIRSGRASSTILLGERGYLGVRVRNQDGASVPGLGLNVTSGALVIGVQPGSPAESAGMTAPAVIVAINDVPVASTDALGSILRSYVPGTRVRVSWIDQQGSHSATVNLISGPAV